MARTLVDIATDDGVCPSSMFIPSTPVPAPAVIMYMDGIGIRPALFEMGERLAHDGYFVLLPDLFYRGGPYTAPSPITLFSDLELRAKWSGSHASTATQSNVMRDTAAFLTFLAGRSEVRGTKVGTTGYCMGGGLALAAAAFYPDRIVAAAAFHAGRLATDDPTSPHLLVPKLTARVYVAAANNDPADQTERFARALAESGVAHEVLTYPAKHGWVPSDTPMHDPEQAERHWKALRDLFGATLA
jgi:carboxymethylenebutenolidase